MAGCPGAAVEASNGTDYRIPESDWVHSSIVIADAPADAVVTCSDVHFEIVHPLTAGLWIGLDDEGLTHEYTFVVHRRGL